MEIKEILTLWVTSPNNFSWNGLTSFSIPPSENLVTLTIEDDSTGCTESKNINLLILLHQMLIQDFLGHI